MYIGEIVKMTAVYCRFCAELKSIQKVKNYTSPLPDEILEKFKLITKDFVDFDDKTLPEIICDLCYDVLYRLYDFFIKVKESQVVLSKIFPHQLKLECDSHSDHVDDNDSIKLEDCSREWNDTDNNRQSSNIQPSPWSSYPWLCGHCSSRFSSSANVRNHCKMVHASCCSWQCSDCLERVDEYNDFINHVNIHRNALRNYCECCNLKLEEGHTHSNSNQISCKFCGDSFDNQESLLLHLKHYQKGKDSSRSQSQLSIKEPYTESWGSYPWVCNHCDMILSSQEMLRNHSKLVHEKCNGMKCADCDTHSNNFGEFIEHVRRHRETLRYRCQYCDIPLTDNSHTDRHYANNYQSTQCDACGEFFQNKRDLREHILKYNKTKRTTVKKKENGITEEVLTCNSCGKYAKSIKSLRSHMKVHTERNRDYTCDRCGKNFFTKADLSVHNVIHQNRDPEVCKICQKTFLTLTRLKKHIKTHYNERPFRCEVCHKCFRLKEHLKSHAVIHTDDMPYHCQYCEKSFKHRHVLKIHKYQHTGQRPYSCDICNMHFANWSNCNKHLMRKHGTTLAKSVMTPHGKMPINPKTGKPKKFKDLEAVKDWTESIMGGKKTGCSGYDVAQ